MAYNQIHFVSQMRHSLQHRLFVNWDDAIRHDGMAALPKSSASLKFCALKLPFLGGIRRYPMYPWCIPNFESKRHPLHKFLAGLLSRAQSHGNVTLLRASCETFSAHFGISWLSGFRRKMLLETMRARQLAKLLIRRCFLSGPDFIF